MPNKTSNFKKYTEYFKHPKKEGVVPSLLVSLREYGIFIMPLVLAYLLFYYIVFENGGSENGQRVMYVIILISAVVVVIGSFFLRKIYRKHKFNRYSSMSVPLYKKNEWTWGKFEEYIEKGARIIYSFRTSEWEKVIIKGDMTPY